MKKWGFIMALLMIVLAACGLEEENPNNATIDESVPPKVMITTSNESYNMMQGGYEWTVEGRKKGEQTTTIADAASPNQVLTGEELTTIAKSETLTLQFVVEPDRYELYGWYEDGSKISVDSLEQLKGDEPVAIEVLAYYPQGHASYVLPVKFQ